MAEKKKVPGVVDGVKPLDIAAILGKPKNRVSRMGIELEGGWSKVPTGANIERDGSVFAGGPVAGFKVGELPLGPMQPAAMPKFMRKYYPQKVDATCGMHVHMSFETLRHYGWLMVPEYQETMLDALTIWAKKEGFEAGHHIFNRLEGKNEFCQKKFWPDEQVGTKRKDFDHFRQGCRYTVIHYCGRQSTIEVRVLPMMKDAEQAIRAVRHVVDVTNACLTLLADKQDARPFVSKLEIPGGEVYEEVIEEELPLTAAQRRRLR